MHLTSSRFFGGPERQMLELARELMPEIQTSFLSFSEDGHCRAFVDKVRANGFPATALRYDTPRLLAAAREVKGYLVHNQADVLVCHGYKAGLLGWWAARRAGIPIVAVSRGWTGENRKIRLYECLDRRVLRYMDRVACVSEGQARKIRRLGIPEHKIAVIRNAIRTERFAGPSDPAYRERLEALFPFTPTTILGAAGRLSPEKGFNVLVRACRQLAEDDTPDFGLVLFGEGPLREQLAQQIQNADLGDRVALAGFTKELDRYMPHLQVFVQASHTEGLPNVLLEAAAAGVPVVATDVGGTGEVVIDGCTGLLVRPGDATDLRSALRRMLDDSTARQAMGEAGSRHVAQRFTFRQQAEQYRTLLTSILHRPGRTIQC